MSLLQQTGTSGSLWVPVDLPATNAFISSPSILQSFAAEYEFALKDDWDGCGANALAPSVLRRAEQLVRDLAGTRHLVEIAPGREGSISFVWDDSKGNYIYVDVGPGEAIHLFYNVAGSPKWEGVSVANDAEILRHLARAFAALYPAPSRLFISVGKASSSQFKLDRTAA